MNLQSFPIAFGMVHLARRSNQDIFSQYMCLWSAFNNIYQYLSDRDGFGSKLVYDTNRQLRTIEVAGYILPRVSKQSEAFTILYAIRKLDPYKTEEWLRLPQVSFFVNRTPQGAEGTRRPGTPDLFDSQGQRINGVLNRTRTVDPRYPYYAPIDREKYKAFLEGDLTKTDLLSNQLIMLLYTVRNNLMHGHKEIRSDNDGEVVKKAYPILEELVQFFVT